MLQLQSRVPKYVSCIEVQVSGITLFCKFSEFALFGNFVSSVCGFFPLTVFVVSECFSDVDLITFFKCYLYFILSGLSLSVLLRYNFCSCLNGNMFSNPGSNVPRIDLTQQSFRPVLTTEASRFGFSNSLGRTNG